MTIRDPAMVNKEGREEGGRNVLFCFFPLHWQVVCVCVCVVRLGLGRKNPRLRLLTHNANTAPVELSGYSWEVS